MKHVRPVEPSVLVCVLLGALVSAAPGPRVDANGSFSGHAVAAVVVRGQDAPPKPEQPQTVPGAANFVRLDAGFASGGVTSPEAFAAIKKLGFRTVINLRVASEQGADIDGEMKTVEQAGLRYVGLPFSVNQPDVTAIDRFLDLARDANAQPIYIHCFSGQRANAFWMIKRVLVDGWTPERALAETDTLKMTNQRLRDIATAYLKDHAK